MVYSAFPDGNLVDKKGYNLHMSARPALLANMATAGVTAFTLKTTGDIPGGAIVVEDATTVGRVNIATGAAQTLLGIANYTRQADDSRPLAYTVLGVVEMIAGTGDIAIGDLLTPDDAAGYRGCAKAWATNDADNASLLAAEKMKFGKALTAAVAGGRFWAYVNFMG